MSKDKAKTPAVTPSPKDVPKVINPLTTTLALGLVWFYGILTIEGYLMLNLVYTYILDIYDL